MDHNIGTSAEMYDSIVSRLVDDVSTTPLLDQAIEGLSDYWSCLDDPTFIQKVRDTIQERNTGNNQLDYEHVRDQVEQMCREVDDSA